MNMMCSNRWANPVRPTCSSPEPTWYQVSTATIAWSDPHEGSPRVRSARCTSQTGFAALAQSRGREPPILLSSTMQLKKCSFSQLPLEKEGHRRFDGFTKNILPALFAIGRDRTCSRRRSVGRKAESPCEDPEAQHMERIAYQESALQAPSFENAGYRSHGFARGPTLVFLHNSTVRNPVLP